MLNKEIENILENIAEDYNFDEWNYDRSDQSFDFTIYDAEFYVYLEPKKLTFDNARLEILKAIYDELNDYDGPAMDVAVDPDNPNINIKQVQALADNIQQTASYINLEINGLPEIDGFTEAQMDELDHYADCIHNDAYLYADPELMNQYVQKAYIISHAKEIHKDILNIIPEEQHNDVALAPVNFFNTITSSCCDKLVLKYLYDPSTQVLQQIIKKLHLN